MFTGIITDLGTVAKVEAGVTTRFEIATAYNVDHVPLGASIACSGVCLTVVWRGGGRFAVEVSNETLALTTLGGWAVGRRINLERPLKAGDELGGHIVSGHVDGVGEIVERRPDGESLRLVCEAPVALAPFVAPKGSITIDGVSLTVNEAAGARFGVNIIPHTQSVTSLGALEPGDRVNLEIDVVARYLARLIRPELLRTA